MGARASDESGSAAAAGTKSKLSEVDVTGELAGRPPLTAWFVVVGNGGAEGHLERGSVRGSKLVRTPQALTSVPSEVTR